MKIVFNNEFYKTEYANDNAASAGRIEVIVEALTLSNEFQFVYSNIAEISQIQLAHTDSHIENVKRTTAFDMAMLAAGAAIRAADIAINGEASFALIRPPGHHANKNFAWGHCFFNNAAISLLKLKQEKRIESAFVLDFDAHTGDGTINCLKEWDSCYILNPMADNRDDYMKVVDEYIRNLPHVDIILVCAGFDSYIEDVGKKLLTFDFYALGKKIQLFAKKLGHNRRYGVLEGGYYLPDLGKNVLAFCQGLKD